MVSTVASNAARDLSTFPGLSLSSRIRESFVPAIAKPNTKVFITGGAGFIGFHLARYLRERGNEVISIDNFSHPSKAPSEAVYADIRYPRSYEKFVEWADVVYHLAAQIHVDKSILNPEETVDINIGGTLNVLELCRRYRKRLVFASSSEVYGTSQTQFQSESHPLDAQSPYAASKVAGDRLCKAYADTYGMDVRILRNFNTFGEWQNDTSYGGVIAIFTRAAFENRPLNIYGDGSQERDYMYITDALEGYRIIGENADLAGQTLNIGSGKTISINLLASLIKKITKSRSEIRWVEPRPGEVMRLCADITRARNYGFQPQTDLERDLYRYTLWCKENK